jgi:eukaryotic-like serine/threonine-protein kinase
MDRALESGSNLDEHGELLAPGTRVGDFVIDRVLGAGGFGTVYAATNPLIARRVAIKVLALRYSVDPHAVSRFLMEARVVNQVRHKNIVDIAAFDRLIDGRHYHVMEYLRGETLEQLLARRGRLPLAEAAPLFTGVAAALTAAHRRGIAHRDLKPANIFVIDDGGVLTPKIIDFGIAKLSSDETGAAKTKSGTLLGTPRYMSPEQARGKSVDHRSDIYSFGLVIYETLTGTSPFNGADDLEILVKHASHQPDPPCARFAGLPKAIDAIVLPMLDKDPERRPASLLPVARLLERAALGEEIDLHELAPERSSGKQAEPGISADDTLPIERESGEPVRTDRRTKRPTTLILIAAAALLAAGAWIFRPDASRLPTTASASVPVAPTSSATAATTTSIAPLAAAISGRVEIRIEGTPSNTEVLGPDGVKLGNAPGTIEVARRSEPLELTFRRTGWIEEARVVIPSAPQALRVDMRRRAAARANRAGPDDSENPFR